MKTTTTTTTTPRPAVTLIRRGDGYNVLRMPDGRVVRVLHAAYSGTGAAVR